MNALARQKAALRTRMKAVRAAIGPDQRGQAAARATERLFEVAGFSAARTVLLFSSFGSEIPTVAIAKRLLDDDRKVLFPFLDGGQLGAAWVRDAESLATTTYGPLEPSGRVAVDPGEIDVAVVPGLAFDRLGNRVGFGGGHYDRYLRRLPQPAIRIGLAFHVQLMDAVPHGPRDQPVDMVVTDQETIDCRAERRRRGSSGG
jgi:5-formyltetrahydrofolate cyclo-ligase